MNCSTKKNRALDSCIPWSICGVLLTITPLHSLGAGVQPTVFGFQLGQELEIPQCPMKRIGSIEVLDISFFTCSTEIHERYGQPKPTRNIIFPANLAPTIVKKGTLTVLENKEKLIGIEFATRGAESQEFVLSELKAKFGKPTHLKFEHMTNGFGASFHSIFAWWVRKEFSVTFSGTFGQIDEGRVLIDTTEATAIREQARARDVKQKTPL